MRLGLIGGTDNKRTSGVYQPEDVVALQDAKKYISRFGYDGVFNALTSSGTEEGFDVSRDGRYVYVAVRGTRTIATIFQYECTTPWDLSTITYSSKSLVVGDYDVNCNGIAISDDGTRLFFTGYNGDTIWSCTLSTPYDLATATVDVKKFYVGTQDATPRTPFFGDTGTKMYTMGATNDRVYQYNLTTAWDVTTASYSNNSLLVTSQEPTPLGLFFGDSGTKLYVVGTTNDTVYQYSLTTAWDISTASYASISFSVTTQETAPAALFFKPDGTKMYVIGSAGDDVNEYDLGTAWNVSTASFVRVSAAVGETAPTGLWFKDDGTKMYVTGSTNDTVREFSLSTAWNVSTISFVQSLSVGFETAPTGVTFKDDGTELYVLGQTNDTVYEIQLGTAWDISTAKGFIYVGGTESVPRGIHINNDGTLLFLAGDSNNIRKYTLSTAYELGTATLSQSFALTGSFGVHVFADGLRIYATVDSGGTSPAGGRQVRQITLTSPNDLTTASTSSVELIPLYGFTGASSTPWGVRVSPDGTRMFVLSDAVQGMYQFSLRFA
jgi:DNA-binding beta-propeller fold protein YncE